MKQSSETVFGHLHNSQLGPLSGLTPLCSYFLEGVCPCIRGAAASQRFDGRCRDEDALADFSQAIALDGGLAAAHADRGALLQKLREADAAAGDFDR